MEQKRQKQNTNSTSDVSIWNGDVLPRTPFASSVPGEMIFSQSTSTLDKNFEMKIRVGKSFFLGRGFAVCFCLSELHEQK